MRAEQTTGKTNPYKSFFIFYKGGFRFIVLKIGFEGDPIKDDEMTSESIKHDD